MGKQDSEKDREKDRGKYIEGKLVKKRTKKTEGKILS